MKKSKIKELTIDLLIKLKKQDTKIKDLKKDIESTLIYKNTKFNWGLYGNQFCIWNELGNLSLGACRIIMEEPITDGLIDFIEIRCKDYLNEVLHCTDCGTILNNTEKRYQYMAGRYCKKCWDREYRNQAMNETYN